MPAWVTVADVPELTDALTNAAKPVATASAPAADLPPQADTSEKASAEPVAAAAAETDSTAEWFYSSAGQQTGPVPHAHLVAWLESGQLPADTLIWRDGMAEWTAAAQTPEFAGRTFAPASAAAVEAGGQSQLQYYAHRPGFAGEPVYVGFWWRVLAYFIDYFVLLIPSLVINFAFTFAAEAIDTREARIALALSSSASGIVLAWLYYAMMEASAKQGTLGKVACGLIVTDLQGQRLTFGRATGRYFAKMLSYMILFIGVIMVAFTQRKQGLHDIMASTYVVKK